MAFEKFDVVTGRLKRRIISDRWVRLVAPLALGVGLGVIANTTYELGRFVSRSHRQALEPTRICCTVRPTCDVDES
jgi:hypothetical protein